MGYKILIADDEPEIRDLLRLYLENEQYEVVEAEDGRQALSLLREKKPDPASSSSVRTNGRMAA